jgi:hypothetical protein
MTPGWRNNKTRKQEHEPTEVLVEIPAHLRDGRTGTFVLGDK